ncbi:MAG: LPS export ABC transporter periplasmic protein LptC [Ignavibacteria bacterium]|nr:LPS export ABC transporter periplasmic protein LptC [Ignavibacteria bacterium]
MRQAVIIASMLLVLAGCEDKIRPSVLATVETDIPTQESWNSTVIFSDSARTKAVLWAGHIASYAQQQFTLLSDSLRVDFYNELEEHTSVLTARRGRVNDRTQDFAAYFNVVVTSDSGTVLVTDSLFWTNAGRQIHTDAFVEIISPTEHIKGHGLVSDQGLKNYRISRVTGQAITKE